MAELITIGFVAIATTSVFYIIGLVVFAAKLSRKNKQ